jgi:hypothetical protein
MDDKPSWWDSSELDAAIPAAARLALIAYLAKKELVVASRHGSNCTCDLYIPVTPGNQYAQTMACLNCSPICPRCKCSVIAADFTGIGGYDGVCIDCVSD